MSPAFLPPRPRGSPGSSGSSSRRVVQLPPRIVLLDLDEELADYLRAWFALHWPEAQVRHVRGTEPSVADLIIVDQRPNSALPWPTLWLAEVDRSNTLHQIGPKLWRTAMPATGRRLQQVMAACLAMVTD